MNRNSVVWELLHDGGVEHITGTIPGIVSIGISIRYLRQQFPGEGTGFRIELFDCRRLVYQEYDSQAVINFDAIVALEPEIVGVGNETGFVVVNCVMGTLEIDYGAASIYLDSGEPVTIDELTAASKAYWDDWSARSSRSR